MSTTENEKNRVCDLHCDLLWYLASAKGRTPNDKAVRCSFPDLKKGNVSFQALSIFTETGSGSSKSGLSQLEAFKATSFPLKVQLAIENASSLIEEDEKLDLFFERFEKLTKEGGKPLYMSLTWNGANRFGGGNLTEKGITPEGKILLEYIADKGIFIDFSHTSDRLAYDILNHIDQKGLKLTPIASHSNFRSVTHHARNLPDPLALEIIRRKGVIGLNLIRKFVGEPFEEHYLKHVEYAKKLNGLGSLALGADFFFEDDIPPENRHLVPHFATNYDDASCYPRLLNLLKSVLKEEEIRKVAHENVERILKCF